MQADKSFEAADRNTEENNYIHPPIDLHIYPVQQPSGTFATFFTLTFTPTVNRECPDNLTANQYVLDCGRKPE